jgi:hypothetical protein
MPQLEYFLVARGAVVDRFTNTLSIFGVIDDLTPRRLPAVMLRVVAVMGWNATREEFGQDVNGQLRIVIPGQPDPIVLPFAFRVDALRHRQLGSFVGLPVPAAGEIAFELLLNDAPLAHHRVLVNAPDPQVQPDGWLMYQEGEPAVPPQASGPAGAN